MTGVVITIVAGMFLDYFKYKNLIMLGFIILFSLALIAEIFRMKSFKQQYEPKIKVKRADYFSFWDFLKEAPKTNFGKFSIFRLFFTLTGYISIPLISIYLLRELEFSYTLYTAIILSGAIFSLFFLELWGKFTDKYGNYQTLMVTTLILPVLPILWILHPSPIYLILIPSAIGGITWAGFTLAESNFIYDNVKNKKRGLAVSYHNMLYGIGVFVGSIISAILIKYLAISWTKPLIFIFFLSSITRMIAVFLWIPKLKEIRKTKKLKGMQSFEDLIIKEGKATLIDEYHQIKHFKDYLFIHK
jgi:MFS family permease